MIGRVMGEEISHSASSFDIVLEEALPEGFTLGGVHGAASARRYEILYYSPITDKTNFEKIIMFVKRAKQRMGKTYLELYESEDSFSCIFLEALLNLKEGNI